MNKHGSRKPVYLIIFERISVCIFIVKSIIGRTLAILKDLIEAVSSEATKSKTIVYKSVQESLHTTLTLFPVYIHESGRNTPGVIYSRRETRQLQHVSCRLVALQSSSRYQDAFASLAPA